MSKVKTIGVLTSGGDAPGMNACVRAIVRYALHNGLRVKGIKRGYAGLLDEEIFEFTHRSEVAEIIHRGGTILFTARSKEFFEEEYRVKGAEIIKKHEIDALIVIGGNGSYKGAEDLARLGINVIGLPGTIDLDIGSTDYTIGFDTSVNIVMDAINRIRDTSNSHERCSLVEVMGRHAGHIALWAGIAGGADLILLPEHKDTITDDDIVNAVMEDKRENHTHSLIVVAEGFGGSDRLAKLIEERTGIETRATILGYLQRGGSPTALDRVRATMMGVKAVEVLLEGKENRIINYRDGKYIDDDIHEANQMTKSIDERMYDISKIVG
ncbi:MAG TPA: 6-phosphofructokinase [Clostridiales bacterium]|nr:MAG: 6-phosphofructokinase [Clostridiales bacterium GWD2_32_19]HCC06572.1 6-phosphofructokinase [Clostridiales bacterium]